MPRVPSGSCPLPAGKRRVAGLLLAVLAGLSVTLSLHAQQPSAQASWPSPRGDAGLELPPTDTRKARRAFEEGRAAEQRGRAGEAFAKYAEALSLAPDSREYLVARERARYHALQEHVDRADREALAGRLWAAERELYSALGLDPAYALARERLAQLPASAPRKPVRKPLGELQMDTLRPAEGVKSFDYRGNTLGAYEEIARQFGLTATFDQDLGSKSIRFRAENVDFHTAAYLLGRQMKTFLRALSEKMFFVTNDTPEKRRQYEPQLTLTVQLDASNTPERMAEIRQAVRDIAGLQNVQLDARTRQLALSGPAQSVQLAAELVAELEQARSEVMLDVRIFEVARTLDRQLGVRPPVRAQAFTLTPEQIAEAQSSPEGLLRVLSQVFSSGGVPLSTAQAAAGQVGTGAVNTGALIPPLIAFGGGRSVFLATLPGASVQFAESLSLLRRARRVLLRSEDGQESTFFVGDRVPISMAVLSPSLNAPVVLVGLRVEDFSTGDEPRAVATGEFDGSNGPDFVVANTGDTTLSVFLNTGDARFGTPASVSVDDGPRAVVARDFDGDTFLDLAVAHVRANTVAILLGNGDGTFGAPSAFPTQLEPVALAAGEFTGDSFLDLIVANQSSDSITLFPGNGDGTFGAGTDIQVGTAPRAVLVGDWNADSISDLAVANSGSSTVSILLGNGNGTFATPPVLTAGNSPSALATADFNLDGFSDIVVTNQDSNSISVFLGLGNGTFGAATEFSTGSAPTGIVAADFTNDGRADLVVANSGASVVSVLAGVGDGTFIGAADVTLTAAAFAMASADLDADGRLDLVTVSPDADLATVIVNNSTATNTAATGVPGAIQPYPAALYEDVGVKVRATPRMHPNAEVTLKMEIEMKDLSTQTFNGIPVISNRTVEQTVRLREGETTILSGIVSTDNADSLLGWPWLAPVPGAGYTAAAKRREAREVEVLIAVTPRRLRLAPRKSRSLYTGQSGESPAPPPQPPQ